jgi:hypothetical protein
MVRPRPGFSCNADGSRLPLGQHVEVRLAWMRGGHGQGRKLQLSGGNMRGKRLCRDERMLAGALARWWWVAVGKAVARPGRR